MDRNRGDLLETCVARARRLFSLPAAALEVLRLTAKERVDVQQLRGAIERDPAIASKILRVVNSSLYGLSREVVDLSQAVALLGIKPLKLLVLGFSLSDALSSQTSGPLFARYWRYALTKAAAAREVARRIAPAAEDEAFIAALLQDIGMLVLLQELGEPYANFLRRTIDNRQDINRCEEASLGFSHLTLSLRLLEAWHLPAALVGATRMPDRARGDESKLQTCLKLATWYADLLVDGREDALARIAGCRNREGQICHADEIVEAIQTQTANLADLLTLTLPAGFDYRDILVAAQQRMAMVSEEVSARLIRATAGIDDDARPELDLGKKPNHCDRSPDDYFPRQMLNQTTTPLRLCPRLANPTHRFKQWRA